MKTALFVFTSIILSQFSHAAVPGEVEKFLDRDGVFISIHNGKNTADNGSHCRVVKNPYGEESSIVINSIAYFQPVAHFEKSKKSVSEEIVFFELRENGRRPGGSVCGDMIPLLSYKKWVEISKDKFLIKQKYRCALERETLIVEGCQIQK